MNQPKPQPQARPEGTTIQADGKKSLNDYATTFYHNATLGAALGSVQQKLSVTDPAKPQPRGTTLFIPGMLVGQGQPKSGGVLIDAAYRRTGAVVLVEDPSHPNTFLEGPPSKSGSPLIVRQWVNERTSHCGMDHKGWVRNVCIGPAGALTTEGVTWGVAAVLTIRVRFTPHPDLKARSERTDPPWGVVPRSDFQMTPSGPLPADNSSPKRSGVDNEKRQLGALITVPCSTRPVEYTITKHLNPGDPPFILTVLLGIGGGDRCEVEVTTGDPQKVFQSKVIFENWRVLHYEIVAPDSMLNPYLEHGSGAGKCFSRPIREYLSSNLESLFILFKQTAYTQIPLIPSQVGIVPGESIGIARPLGFVASDETIDLLPAAKRPSSRSNFLQFFLADAMFTYNHIAALKTAKLEITSAKSTKKTATPNGDTIFFPPAILSSKIPNKPISSQSIDLANSTWKSIISNPQKYYSKPGFSIKKTSQSSPTPMLNDGIWEIRILDIRISSNSQNEAPLLDGIGREIKIPLYFARDAHTLSMKSQTELLKFLSTFAIKENLRLGKFNFEVRYLDSSSTLESASKFNDSRTLPYNAECISNRLQNISEFIASSSQLSKPLFTHPGLDNSGNPIQGKMDPSMLDIKSYKLVEITLPTSKPGEPLKIGDFIDSTETDFTCKIEAIIPITSASLLEGGYKKGSRLIECSAYLHNSVPVSKWPEFQLFFGQKLLHEIGHSIGMTPFKNTYYSSVGNIPGVVTPANIDAFNPDGSRGTYYSNNNTPNTSGRDGIRNGHEGPHCASGLSIAFISSVKISKPPPTETPNCIMFGEICSANSFCQICKKAILSRCIDDVQSFWTNRA